MGNMKPECCSIPFNYDKPPDNNTSGFIHEPIKMDVMCNCKKCLKKYIIEKCMEEVKRASDIHKSDIIRAMGDTLSRVNCRSGCS